MINDFKKPLQVGIQVIQGIPVMIANEVDAQTAFSRATQIRTQQFYTENTQRNDAKAYLGLLAQRQLELREVGGASAPVIAVAMNNAPSRKIGAPSIKPQGFNA